MKKNFLKFACLFLLGGIVYYSLEVSFRGHSHYSMFFAGGVSLLLINLVCNKSNAFKNRSILIKAFIGGLVITTVEFVVGIMFNIILKMNVWDYSKLPLNILGQICIPFTFLWMLLSIPALYVCNIIDSDSDSSEKLKNNKEKI